MLLQVKLLIISCLLIFFTTITIIIDSKRKKKWKDHSNTLEYKERIKLYYKIKKRQKQKITKMRRELIKFRFMKKIGFKKNRPET